MSYMQIIGAMTWRQTLIPYHVLTTIYAILGCLQKNILNIVHRLQISQYTCRSLLIL